MRPIPVSVGPSLASTANDIATSQSPAGTSGRAAVTFTGSSASIAATNSFVAGQPVTFLNVGGSAGFAANSGTVGPVGLPPQFIPGNTYYVLSSGLSGSAFEVALKPGGSAVVPSSAGSGTNYVVYGANVALNGSLVNSSGVAVLPTAQRVLITTADSTTKFTISGTGAGGQLQSETVVSNGTNVQSVLDYATVTSITTNQAPTASLTVGTNGVGSTPWVRTDEWAEAQVSIQCNVTGTVNYTVQASNDDPNDPSNPVTPSNMTWINSNDPAAVGATGAILTNFLFSPRYVRVLLNSGSGSVTATVTQYNVANR